MYAPKLSWLVFAIHFAISIAYDITTVLRPLGPLGVTLDISLARSWPVNVAPANVNNVHRNWLWSSYLTFNGPVSQITDAQLWRIAADAYNEMQTDRVQYGISDRGKSKALSVLAWGNHLILSSTQKGSPSFSYNYPLTPVLQDLQLCQQVWYDVTGTGQPHRAQGGCAEPMACQLYYTVESAHLSGQSARIGTMVENRHGVVEQQDPCPPPNVQGTIWGCNVFVTSQNLRVIDRNIQSQAYDLSTLAGGLVSREQIQLCSVVRRFNT